MNQRYTWLLMGALAVSIGGVAAAQDAATPAQTPATPAQTPATPAQTPAAAPQAPAPAAKPAPKSTAQIDAGEPRATTSAAPASGSAAAAASTPAATPEIRTRAAPAQKAPGAADRLNLGTATVTGDREQPKVMYIVPWKKSDIGDLSGKPMNSLLDEALAPVDRDEFKREVAYFDAVKADTSQNNAANGAAKQVEK